MTGYTVHTGSNDRFAGAWDRIFGGGSSKPKAKAAQKSTSAKAAKKKVAKKKAAAKKSGQ